MILLCFILIYPRVRLIASQEEQGLDIKADSGDTNLQTAISRLQGNVVLQHKGFIVTGDKAEIQSASESKPQRYIIAGTPTKFEQQTQLSTITAYAMQIVYTPVEELMVLQENISLTQSDDNNNFMLQANELQLLFDQGRPQQIITTGKPTVFTHEMSEKKIQIQAEKIIWDTQTKLANIYKAQVQEGQTTFSAEKITYNAKTGEISATGDGETRPSYRYDPEKTEEQNNNNDS